jgi:RIO kinase 1
MAARRSAQRRRRFDDEWASSPEVTTRRRANDADDTLADPDEPSWSTYAAAVTGPHPVPSWVVTDPRVTDVDLGVVKTGKEADVSLLRRELAVDDEEWKACLRAVKRYRSAEHRLFHRDAAYLEGRRVRKSREMRTMATRTTFGRELIAQQWAIAEFDVLATLWSAGAAVPYPVQLHGAELMMEFIGSPDGVAAPRLAEVRATATEARVLRGDVVEVLVAFAEAGYAHGDLSPYNVLVSDGRVVVIDVPQAVDLVGNPQGFEFLRRDCENICRWFAARGVNDADTDVLMRTLSQRVPGMPNRRREQLHRRSQRAVRGAHERRGKRQRPMRAARSEVLTSGERSASDEPHNGATRSAATTSPPSNAVGREGFEPP